MTGPSERRRRHGLHVGRGLRRPPGQPGRHPGLGRPGQSGVEVLTPIPPRAAARGGTSWPPRGAERGKVAGVTKDDEAGARSCCRASSRNVTCRQERPRLDPELRVGQRRRGHHLRERGADGQEGGAARRDGRPGLDRPDREPGRGRRQERDDALRHGVAEAFVEYLHTERPRNSTRASGSCGRSTRTEGRAGERRVPADRGPLGRRRPRRLGRAERQVFGDPDGIFTTAFAGRRARRRAMHSSGSRGAPPHFGSGPDGAALARARTPLRQLSTARRCARSTSAWWSRCPWRPSYAGIRRTGSPRCSRRSTFRGAGAAIRLTLSSSAMIAVINAVVGTLIAYVLVRFRFPGRNALSTVVDLPIAIPTLVTGSRSWRSTARTRRSADSSRTSASTSSSRRSASSWRCCSSPCRSWSGPSSPSCWSSTPPRRRPRPRSAPTAGPRSAGSCCRRSGRRSSAGALLSFARALGEFGSVVFVERQHHRQDPHGAGLHLPAHQPVPSRGGGGRRHAALRDLLHARARDGVADAGRRGASE